MVSAEESDVVMDETGVFLGTCKHARYQQFHKGYPVEGKTMNVLSKCGVALTLNGSVLEGLNVNNTGLLSKSDALDYALADINADKYIWEDTATEDSLKAFTGDPNATNFPDGRLVISKIHGASYADVASNYKLCWRFLIRHFDTLNNDTFTRASYVYVDAKTGGIVSQLLS